MRHVVQGVVFDSVANRPLADATVQLAAREGPSAPLTATSDAGGRYLIANVAPGRYVLGFYHDALTALGLDAPLRSLDVGSDSLVMADLAVPASRTIRTLRCGESAFESSSGMMVGFIRDAEQRAAVPGAKLQLAWRAFALDAGNYRTVTERATATIEDDGSYLACHLPIDAPLDLQVTGPGHRAVGGTVAVVPAGGIGRLDVSLADSTIVRGSAIIRGRVTRSSGKAVSTGRAAITSLGREVPIEAGAFVLGDLPQGTWVVETRVMGSDPQSVLVNATDSAATLAAITVADQAQHLGAVTVVGKKDANSLLLDEVLRRKRIGMGTVFLPGSPALKSATFTSDVMREARGFIYRGPTKILGRGGVQTSPSTSMTCCNPMGSTDSTALHRRARYWPSRRGRISCWRRSSIAFPRRFLGKLRSTVPSSWCGPRTGRADSRLFGKIAHYSAVTPFSSGTAERRAGAL
jgi:hypothetical protein